MKYDFENPPSRAGTDCYQYDLFPGLFPMWVADMDFKAAPEIIEALRKRVEHGIYGYAMIPEGWAKSYQDFFGEEYGWEIQKEELVYSLGVVPILSSSVRALTNVGDNVVIMPPVYNIFYNSIRNNKRNIYEVPLIDKEGKYFMDFGALERAFAEEKTTLCIFCNPGNPTARIWSKEEINALAELGRKYHVIILSDEIHGLLPRPGLKYQPFLTANEKNKEGAFAAISPTKAFNLAGLHTSALVCPDEAIRKKVERQLNTDEVAEPNVFSCVASMAAFNEGREWLRQCREILFANRDYATAYIRENIPGLVPYEGDATYLLWVDHKAVEEDTDKLLKYLQDEQKLLFNNGIAYGKGGEGHLRINLACPKAKLIEGLRRLKEGVASYGRK